MEKFLYSLSHMSNSAMWTIFGVIVITMLYLDLFIFHKKNEEPNIKSVIKICVSYISIALLFGLFVIYEKGAEIGMLYYTGYLVELSLSMDNIFVISLIFTSLCIPNKYQHRVLFWGILGAVCMRAIMIMLGAALVSEFQWVLYIFSIFLILTGIKLLMPEKEEQDISESKLFKFISSKFRVTSKIESEHFFVKKAAKLYITPLFLALILIEIMDVIFAVDSIPAIFLITQDIFVVYTSNIFAILGLRSLYFLLAAAVSRFVYLKHSLAIILIFIGCKIFVPDILGVHVPASVSLTVTFSILLSGIVFSLIKTRKQA